MRKIIGILLFVLLIGTTMAQLETTTEPKTDTELVKLIKPSTETTPLITVKKVLKDSDKNLRNDYTPVAGPIWPKTLRHYYVLKINQRGN